MSRRDLNRTDTSVVTVTDSLKSLMATSVRHAGDMTGLTFLDETSLRSWGPEQVLSRMLSTKSYISTTSSSAVRDQEAQDNELQTFKQIGKGQCGTIWALLGTAMILKVPNESKEDSVWTDCCRHKRIEEAFQQTFLEFRQDINIPKFGDWIDPSNSKFWREYGQYFPQGFRPTCGLMSERIHALPFPIRGAIFDAFAPKSLKSNRQAFLSCPENKDCLIRLYLGRRVQRSSTNAFRLRNFDLTVNEMEYLRLDTSMYARAMAQALAVLHWKANVDANDVEFVLGSAPKIRPSATAAEYEATSRENARFIGQTLDFQQRSVGIWLLDFNQCNPFPVHPNGVKQLQQAFYFNDPYFPGPISTNAKDKELWETFKATYLKTSVALTNTPMPKMFIDAVETEGRKRRSGGSLFG